MKLRIILENVESNDFEKLAQNGWILGRLKYYEDSNEVFLVPYVIFIFRVEWALNKLYISIGDIFYFFCTGLLSQSEQGIQALVSFLNLFILKSVLKLILLLQQPSSHKIKIAFAGDTIWKFDISQNLRLDALALR